MIAYGTSRPPGTSAPCRCFFPLGLALEEPDGALSVDFRNPEWILFGGVAMKGSKSVNYGVRWCPACGGKLEPYTAADRDAYAAYLAAEARYDGLRAMEDYASVRAFAAERGAVEVVDEAEWSASYVDRANHLEVEASYDPDHERVYATCRFFRGDA